MATLALVLAVTVSPGGADATTPTPGSFDVGFSHDGRHLSSSPGIRPSVAAADVAVVRRAVVVVGSLRTGRGAERRSRFLVTRLSPNGRRDRAFGRDGQVLTRFAGDAVARRVAAAPGGRLLVAGTAGDAFALAMYLDDGRLDVGFGDSGLVTTDVSSGRDVILDVRVSGGAILVAGTAGDEFALARYDLDGSLDPEFGSAGLVRTTGGFDGTAYDVALDTVGRLVAVGVDADTHAFSVARYTSEGHPDITFGAGDGRVRTSWGDGEYVSRAYTVLIQPDGRIVAGGYTFAYDYSEFALARYLPDGSLDRTFARDGRATMFLDTYYSVIHALAVQRDGAIVAAGHASGGNPGGSAVARFTADGRPDVSFGNAGRRVFRFAHAHDPVLVAVTTSRGRVVVAGGRSVARPGIAGARSKSLAVARLLG